ncbi:hypothetical protein OEW28_09515 [Defluviimonas sp. WL0002]|uniref:Uncharacterized protein n=1 Tax=Albidovulum marisflavi TaxID=2984159 RepID=A0ABT2ZCJ6_9RHOB|nr:hypothetical protein [Defluviimonas sp. WL0002]MCV2868865.1 hypothetical protein [Defluviimonas sp. WL0002]
MVEVAQHAGEDPNVRSWKTKAKRVLSLKALRERRDAAGGDLDPRYQSATARVAALRNTLEGVPGCRDATLLPLDTLSERAAGLHQAGDVAEAVKVLEAAQKVASNIANRLEGAWKEIYKRERKAADDTIKVVHKHGDTRKKADTQQIVAQWKLAEAQAEKLLIDSDGLQIRDYAGASEGMKKCRAMMDRLLPEDWRTEGAQAGDPDASADKRLAEAKYDELLRQLAPLKDALLELPRCNTAMLKPLDTIAAEAADLHDDALHDAVALLGGLHGKAVEIAAGLEATARQDFDRERGLTDKAVKLVFKHKETRKQADRSGIVAKWKEAEALRKTLKLDKLGLQVRDYWKAAEAMMACRALLNNLLPEELRARESARAQDQAAMRNQVDLDAALPPVAERGMELADAVLTALAPPDEDFELFAQTFALQEHIDQPSQEAARARYEAQVAALRQAQTERANHPLAQDARRIAEQIKGLDPETDADQIADLYDDLQRVKIDLDDAMSAAARDKVLDDAEQITAAFTALSEDEDFDVYLDAHAFDATDENGNPKPELVAAKEQMDKVIAATAVIKANGGNLADIAALWDTVPEAFRPDEVVEELRPYAIARKAILGESAESRAESATRFKQGIGKIALTVTDVIDTVLTATLDNSTFQQLVEEGTLLDGAGSGDQPADDEWFDVQDSKFSAWVIAGTELHAGICATTIGVERTGRKAALADGLDRNNPEVLLELERARSGRIKMAQHLREGRKMADAVVSTVKVFAVHPALSGFLTMVKGVLKLIKAFEYALERLEAAEKELMVMTTQRDVDRTNPVNQSAEAMRAALTQNKKHAERLEKANKIAAAGQILRGGSTVVAGTGEPGTAIAGLAGMGVGGGMEAVGVTLVTRAEYKNFKTNKAEETRCIELLQRAAAGDSEAKKSVMKESSFYSAMYLALAAKEGDAIAMRILNDMHFTAEDIEKNNVYILRKAMLWAAKKDDRSPDEAGMVGIGVGKVKSAGSKFMAGVETAGDILTRQNRTDDRVVVAEFVAEFTLQNWEETKKAAYASGVRERKTGIAKEFGNLDRAMAEIMLTGPTAPAEENQGEKSAAKRRAKFEKALQDALNALDALFHLFGSVDPEWISPRPDGQSPVGFAEYLQEMRNLAAEHRTELLNLMENSGADLRAPAYRILPSLDPARFDEACKIASLNGVQLDDRVKAARKLIVSCHFEYPKIIELTNNFDGDAKKNQKQREKIVEFIALARSLSAALSQCAPKNLHSAQIDTVFRQFASDLSQTAIEEYVSPIEEVADAARETFATQNPPAVELVAGTIRLAYRRAREECLMTNELPDALDKALDQLPALMTHPSRQLSDDDLGADNIIDFDEQAQVFLKIESGLREWGRSIKDHKPFFKYLMSVAALAGGEAREADRKKAICVQKRDGQPPDQNLGVRPRLASSEWLRWLAAARADMEKSGDKKPVKYDKSAAAGTTQAFKNYEKAPPLLSVDELEEDVKHARKVFKKRRHALKSLDILLARLMKVEGDPLCEAIDGFLMAVATEGALIDEAEVAIEDYVAEQKRQRRA